AKSVASTIKWELARKGPPFLIRKFRFGDAVLFRFYRTPPNFTVLFKANSEFHQHPFRFQATSLEQQNSNYFFSATKPKTLFYRRYHRPIPAHFSQGVRNAG